MEITETYRVKNKNLKYETVARINYTFGHMTDDAKMLFTNTLRLHKAMLQVTTFRDSVTKQVISVWVYSWAFQKGWIMAVHYRRTRNGWVKNIKIN